VGISKIMGNMNLLTKNENGEAETAIITKIEKKIVGISGEIKKEL